jgi:hypothetical protein
VPTLTWGLVRSNFAFAMIGSLNELSGLNLN